MTLAGGEQLWSTRPHGALGVAERGVFEHRRGSVEQRAVIAGGAGTGFAQERGTLRELAAELRLAGEDLSLEFVAPAGHGVDPGFHAPAPASGRGHRE